MQRFPSHLNGFAACEEVCNAAIPPPSMYRRRPPVVCPKPRRVEQWALAGFAGDLRPALCTDQAGTDLGDLATGAELLEIFLKKDCYHEEETEQPQPWRLLSSSPPYFCGSPPRRASNPLVHDPNFLQGKHQQQQNNSSLTQPPLLEQTYSSTTNITTPLTSTIAAQFPFQASSGAVPSASGFPATATAGGARRACLRSSDNFGPSTAMVRIEGFDCLNRREGRGCSISAFA